MRKRVVPAAVGLAIGLTAALGVAALAVGSTVTLGTAALAAPVERGGAAVAVAGGAESAVAAHPAALSTPVGRWRTIDDATGKAKSIVEISVAPGDGRLRGRIVELIDPEEQNPLCTECKGDLHDQPILGMVVLNGLKQENEHKWGGGRILDPENGKTYKVHVELEEGGRVLKLRGYIGFSLIGRTQHWLREGAEE